MQVSDLSGFSFLGASGFPPLTVFFVIVLGLVFSSYIRIATVLGIVRMGLGFASLSAAFATAGLALALSFFVMLPTLTEAGNAVDRIVLPRGAALTDSERETALKEATAVWKGFVQKHTDQEIRDKFAKVALARAPKTQPSGDSVENSWQVLAPAFVTSELKSAFATGLSLFLPFLVIDLLVSAGVTAAGLENLNSATIAFPLKILLFVLVDGWTLITTNLVASYS